MIKGDHASRYKLPLFWQLVMAAPFFLLILASIFLIVANLVAAFSGTHGATSNLGQLR
jgi:hypothetical protein